MRSIVAAVVVAATLCGPANPARAQDAGAEIGYAMAATAANLGYTPFKIMVAAIYLPIGGVAGLLGGGDTRASYALWVPMVGGDYFVTADHIAGRRKLQFLGTDYADSPSEYDVIHYGTVYYRALNEKAMLERPCCKGVVPCDAKKPCPHEAMN